MIWTITYTTQTRRCEFDTIETESDRDVLSKAGNRARALRIINGDRAERAPLWKRCGERDPAGTPVPLIVLHVRKGRKPRSRLPTTKRRQCSIRLFLGVYESNLNQGNWALDSASSRNLVNDPDLLENAEDFARECVTANGVKR